MIEILLVAEINCKLIIHSNRNVGADSETLTSYEVCCPTGEVSIKFNSTSASGFLQQKDEDDNKHYSLSISDEEAILPVILLPQAIIYVTLTVKAK